MSGYTMLIFPQQSDFCLIIVLLFRIVYHNCIVSYNPSDWKHKLASQNYFAMIQAMILEALFVS